MTIVINNVNRQERAAKKSDRNKATSSKKRNQKSFMKFLMIL